MRQNKCDNYGAELLESYLRAKRVYEAFVHVFIQRPFMVRVFSRNGNIPGRNALPKFQHVCITHCTKTILMIVNLTPVAIVFRYARYRSFESQRDCYLLRNPDGKSIYKKIRAAPTRNTLEPSRF